MAAVETLRTAVRAAEEEAQAHTRFCRPVADGPFYLLLNSAKALLEEVDKNG